MNLATLRDLAICYCRALAVVTDNRLLEWQSINLIAMRAEIADVADVVFFAYEQGWVKLRGSHSVGLTEIGLDAVNAG